jgi:hypothetical protein
MTATPRLALPFLSAGQAQKEFTHNEALQTLDTLVGGAVETGPLAVPPASPSIGDAYIVDESPTADWAGRPGSVAAYTSGGWRFVEPVDGLSLYVKSQGQWASFRAGSWEIGQLRGSSVIIGDQQVVGSRAAAIAPASGGMTIDAEARAAIDDILVAMRQHGLIES